MMCMKGAVPESVFGCAGYLFPAGDLVAKKDSDPAFSLASLPQEQLYLALNARCSRTASRSVGDLLSFPVLRAAD